jgi:hypothetical protein
MANIAATDISLSVDPHRLGNMNMAYATMTFGNGVLTYPFGGVPLPAIGRFGIKKAVSDFQIVDPDTDGIIWRYDKTNHTLKAYQRAPLIVFEEVVTLTANLSGTTKYPMAWPLYASNGNQALGLLPAGMTPVTTTIAINMNSSTPGTRATITAKASDAYETITISYITQAWHEVFENLVENETMTAGATTTNGITFTAGTPDVISFITAGPFVCGLMIGLDAAGTVTAPKPIVKDQTAATGEYALDFTNTSPVATTAKPFQTDAWDTAAYVIHFNYIKKPASGFLYDRFIEEDSSSASGQVYTLAGAGDVDIPLLIATPGFIPGLTVSSSVGTWPLGGTGMTLGSTTQWQPTNYYPKQKLTTAGTFTSGTGVSATNSCKLSYIWGVPEDVDHVVPLEMPTGVRLKSRVVRAVVWGK